MSSSDYAIELPVLGIATRFETNDSDVAHCMEEAFGMWRTLAASDGSLEPPLLVRIDVVEGDEGPLPADGHAPVRYSCPDEARVVVETAASVGVSDPLRREARGARHTRLVADRMHFRTEVLEAVTLALLSHFDRHPVHAAAVALNGRAVLLAAPSGTGKSTLAYHCHRDGLDLLGEDHVRVQLEPRVRVWGWPARVRLLTIRHGGVRWARKRRFTWTRRCLQRGSSPTRSPCVAYARRWARIAGAARCGGARERLDEQMSPGFDRFPARWPAVLDALARRGGGGSTCRAIRGREFSSCDDSCNDGGGWSRLARFFHA